MKKSKYELFKDSIYNAIITHSAFAIALLMFGGVFLILRLFSGAVDFLRAYYEADRMKWAAWVPLMCTDSMRVTNAFNVPMAGDIAYLCNKYEPIINHDTDQYILDLFFFGLLEYGGYFLHLILYHYIISAFGLFLISASSFIVYPFLPSIPFLRKKKDD